MAQAGGYDSNLFTNQKDIENFTCSICQFVVKNPTSIGCKADHLFCKSCLISYFDKDQNNQNSIIKCPECRESDLKKDNIQSRPFAQRMLNGFQVKCSNQLIEEDKKAQIGECKWNGQLMNLNVHISNHCELTLVSCLWCNKQIKRFKVDDHGRICPLKQTPCLLQCGGIKKKNKKPFTTERTLMKDWDQAKLIEWIKSIPHDPTGITTNKKNKILAGIKAYTTANDEQVTGSDFVDADASDLKELCNDEINTTTAKRLLKEIGKEKDKEFQRIHTLSTGPSGGSSSSPSNNNNNINNNNNNSAFILNIQGQQAQCQTLTNCYATDKILHIKLKYLEKYSPDIASNKNAYKWDNSKGKVNFKYNGKEMKDNKTLQYYGINDVNLLPILCIFRVKGGSNDDDFKYSPNDNDLYRKRKLRHKKYKQIILSNKPDCIMGYTNSDGIKRARMTCGCAISSDTMFRYLKSEFTKHFKQIKICCPMPKNKCRGSDRQRIWNWSLVFMVADLSDNEIKKYTKAINARNSGCKPCPHCSTMNQRPATLRIWRVRCQQCSNSDWCWECRKIWKSGGYTVCGNNNCMGKKLNDALKVKNCGQISNTGWAKGIVVPKLRACPKCLTLIEFTQACKHMVCLGCPHEFCFKCLREYKSGSFTCTDTQTASNYCNVHVPQVFQ